MSDAVPPNRFRLALVALVVVLALGLLGSLVLRLRRPLPSAAQGPTAPSALKPIAELPPVAAPDNSLERARRAAAVAAIESGDYRAAIDALTEILKRGKGVGDEIELLRIAKDLEARAKDRARGGQNDGLSPIIPTQPTRKPTAPQPKPVAAARPPPPEKTAESQLLVFSVPVGLTVEVDGADFGSTPVRKAISPGTHLVVVLKDGVRLQDRTVTVTAGDVSTLDFDVREKLLAKSDSLKPMPPPSAPEPVRTTPEPEKVAVVQPPEPRSPSPDIETPSSEARGTGEIFVAPSSLGGEVFINGTSYGPLPLLARDVREGAAIVELRANGETKRRKEVVVKKSQRVEVRFR
jgi:hypothetical protein